MRRLHFGGRAAFLVSVAVATGLSGSAQTRRPMTLVDLVGLSRLVDAQLSPDGTRVLYQLNQTDWKANRRPPHLWMQRTAGGTPVQLTFGENESNGRWSLDGKSILFLRDGQLSLLPAEGGESRALPRHATNVGSPAWAPDGSAIYFIATDPPTADERERDRLRNDVTAIDAPPRVRHLWKMTVASGQEQQVTTGATSVLSFRIARDGKRIALHRAPSTSIDDFERGEVWLMNADGTDAAALTHNDVAEDEAELSPDGSQLFFLAQANERFENYHTATLFLMPVPRTGSGQAPRPGSGQAAGGEPRMLIPGFRHWIEHASWAPDGRSIFGVANMGVHSEIFQFDVASRTAKQLTDGRHALPAPPAQPWALVPSAGQMIYLLDEPTRYGDAWTLATTPGAAPVRVTNVYESLDRDFRLPRQDKIEFKSADGTTIEGLLFYPLDYEAGKRYPLVVQMHGGPVGSDRFGFWGWMDYPQVLAAKGYLVFRPNYRGGSGYGDAFLRDMVGKGFFHNAHVDVLAGVDHLVTQGLADPERLALMGHSAGGHLVNKLITMTTRFKAAASAAGVANWISMYAQSDTRAGRDFWFGGPPWQPALSEFYWSQSPVKDAVKVKTPTVFLFGELDGRVPKEQGLEMYRALKAQGVPTSLYIAPRDQHQWAELRHQIAKGNIELEWFEKHVMGRPYVWETAPGDPSHDKLKPTQP